MVKPLSMWPPTPPQIAALIGAHIIKIKLSTEHLEVPAAKKVFEGQKIDVSTQAARVAECMRSAFDGRRIVVFLGGRQEGRGSGLRRRTRDPRRRRQRLDHRAQQLPA